MADIDLIPSYLGQVATLSRACTAKNAGATRTMSRSQHIARDDITSLQIVIANWYTTYVDASNSTVETNAGASASVEAAVEYPVGVLTRVKFGGADILAQADGDTSTSDAVSVAIPRGALFAIRKLRDCSAGIIYSGSKVNGDGLEFGTSGTVANKVMSGTVGTVDATGLSVPPIAIIAQTRRPSVLLIGDSITQGQGETAWDTSLDFGILGRSVGPLAAYSNLGQASARADGFLASCTKRLALQGYFSHVFMSLGRNDLLSRTGAQISGDLASIAALITRPLYGCTVTPLTTSTDAWVTPANQTVGSDNAQRVIVNRWLQAVPPNFVGCIDFARALESSGESGRWATAPSGTSGAQAALTGDGLHPNTLGYLKVRDARLISPGHLTRGLSSVL